MSVDKEGDGYGNANITIKGSARDAADAKREIENLISSNRSGGGRNFDRNERNDRSRNDNSRYESRSESFKDTLEIYPDKVGTVIGRGGETIREVQDKFKVRVNIDKNTNYNGKSTVAVSGGRNDVASAIDHIRNLVGEPAQNGAHSNSYGSQNNYGSHQQPEPMEYEVIDWQAAARESVSHFNRIFEFSELAKLSFNLRRKKTEDAGHYCRHYRKISTKKIRKLHRCPPKRLKLFAHKTTILR